MDYNKIGKFIAGIRKDKGITQSSLADKLNITDRAVSKWECGKGCPDISLLEPLSRILDVSVLELLKGEKISNKTIKDNEVVYSLNYAEVVMQHKIDDIINTVIITIVVILILILGFYNLRIFLYEHQSYNSDLVVNSSDIDFNSISRSINLIKKNKGKYSTDEYRTIISFVNAIEKNYDLENDIELFKQKHYSFSELKDYVTSDSVTNFNDIYILYDVQIKTILRNHNVDVESFVYNSSSNTIIQSFVNNYYQYNYQYNWKYNVGTSLRETIYTKFNYYNSILNGIKEGGNIK